MNPLLISDAYKQSHPIQYPEKTSVVYSNWTPRSDKYASIKGGVVVFGIQAFLMKLNNWFEKDFFRVDQSIVIDSFVEGHTNYFGEAPDTSRLIALHDLGYIPIEVKSLPEGSTCPIGVPMLTIKNTISEFFWVTNFLETIMSTELWMPSTSATIAKGYLSDLMEWSNITCDSDDHIPFQAHDFSMRGMAGFEAARASGAGHLLSFIGSDTIPAVDYLNKYYHANQSKDLVGVSIPATEHSVMSMGTKENELDTFRRLITETYPSGLLSIVSDTWDLWKVCTEYIPQLKKEILARDGKIVIRPDSGDPVDIVCGTGKPHSSSLDNPAQKGVVELLWDVFGGRINSKGYKVLDSHIGVIYGDSITIERANKICALLSDKGFASSNIVFGVGSYTYQYNTRDTYGFAMKATYGEVDGVGREIFKDPVTDDGTKKSLKGLISVRENKDGLLVAKDQCSWTEESEGSLNVVYKDGILTNESTLNSIRETLMSDIRKKILNYD